MNGSTIHQETINPQYCQDDMVKLTDSAFISLIHSLIREYGTHTKGGISCWTSSFTLADKRLLLGYYEGAEWLEYAYKSETNTLALWAEHREHVQSIVDDQCYPVYCEFMEGKGARMVRHPNHDEVYWI